MPLPRVASSFVDHGCGRRLPRSPATTPGGHACHRLVSASAPSRPAAFTAHATEAPHEHLGKPPVEVAGVRLETPRQMPAFLVQTDAALMTVRPVTVELVQLFKPVQSARNTRELRRRPTKHALVEEGPLGAHAPLCFDHKFSGPERGKGAAAGITRTFDKVHPAALSPR